MSQVQKQTNINEFNKFLTNNVDFLEEKYAEHFKDQSFKPKDVKKQIAINYIYDVFTFSKYEKDEKLNKTLRKSLLKNVEEFLEILTKKKQMLTKSNGVQLLKYCIENNQMFSVKYDKKDEKIKSESSLPVIEKEKKEEKIQHPPQKEVEEKPKKQIQENQTEKEKKVQSEKKVEKEEYAPERENTNTFEKDEEKNTMNEFYMEPEPKKINPHLVKKNLKTMFQFYCKQGVFVGGPVTFERINKQCSSMNIGKFLTFTKLTGIMNDKIDKHLIMRKFNLIAEGKKEIQFPKFYEIVKIFAQIDEALIPRLGIDDKDEFKEKLVMISKPFNTKDPNGREPKRASMFIPSLTMHSGKTSEALADEVKDRKKARTARSVLMEQKKQIFQQSSFVNRYDESAKINSSQIMNPKAISNSNIKEFDQKLKILQNIVDDQGDEEWLKDYKLPIQKSAHLPPRVMPRKESIVTDLKKRVQEIAKTETKETVQLPKYQRKKPFSKGFSLK